MITKAELIEAVKAAAITKGERQTLPCSLAFRLAEQYGADLAAIGAICNEQNIRIVSCQLGCFP